MMGHPSSGPMQNELEQNDFFSKQIKNYSFSELCLKFQASGDSNIACVTGSRGLLDLNHIAAFVLELPFSA